MEAKKSGDWMLSAFKDAGINIEHLAGILPREISMLSQDPSMQKTDDMSRIFLECSKLSKDNHFGLHMVDFVSIESLGTFGYLLLNAPTLGELLTIAEKYFATFFLGATVQISQGTNLCKLSFYREGPEVVSPRHGIEWALAFFVRLIQERMEHPWSPLRVNFTHEPLTDLTELSTYFGHNLFFKQSDNSIEFECALLTQKIPEADTQLLSIIKAHADELLAKVKVSSSLESQVQFQIVENLNQVDYGALQVAKALHMSLSTFKRRLQEQQLTYRSLRENVIIDLAKRALGESNSRVNSIALDLGYSDLSAFNRAFSKTTGLTPLAYRKSMINH